MMYPRTNFMRRMTQWSKPRNYRRPRRIPMYRNMWRDNRNAIYRIQLRYQQGATIQNALDLLQQPTFVNGEITTNANLFPMFANLSRTYAQYRIVRLRVQFIPTHPRDVYTTSVGANCPTFVCYVRRNGFGNQNLPNTLSQALGIPYAKQVNGGERATLTFKPGVLDRVYRPAPAVTDGFNPEYDQWLPTNQGDITQYGVDYFMSPAGTGVAAGAYEYRVVITGDFEFKGIKVDSSFP